MRLYIKQVMCLALLFMGPRLLSQNIAVNSSGATANASAILDVSSSTSGLLIPRMTSAQKAALNPLPAAAQGLIVYQTDGVQGFYYNTSTTTTPAWNYLTPGGWSLTGNAGTSAASNFIGTTDAVDWVVRTNNTERMRVLSGGNVGIGTTAPTQKLDVQNGNGRINNVFLGDVGHGAAWGGWSHSSMNSTTGYGLLQSSDGSYTLINKLNTGTGYIGFRVSNSDVAVITNSGDMGIGTTAPAYHLDLNNGTFGFGLSNQRTETRTNAGLQGNAGAQSGFYQNDGSTVTNYPAGAAGWWHLIDVRHSNTANNYAMQFAGSFFDQRLYFRKTNNNAAQAWTEVMTSTSASVIERWYINPANYGPGTTVVTVTIANVTSTSNVSVSMVGDWATNPNITIAHVEARTGAVRFRVVNGTGGTTYTGMDFMLTVIR
jgi:hypothetical protein